MFKTLFDRYLENHITAEECIRGIGELDCGSDHFWFCDAVSFYYRGEKRHRIIKYVLEPARDAGLLN